jgi:hypothetical protein
MKKSPSAVVTNPGIRAFAKKNAVTPEAISKALKTGRLTLDRTGRLGATAQRQWEGQRALRTGHSQSVAGIAAVRLEREKAKLEVEKLNLAERRGKLVDAGKVKDALVVRFQQCRDNARRLHHTLPPKLVGRTEMEIRGILSDEVDRLLAELSDLRSFDK